MENKEIFDTIKDRQEMGQYFDRIMDSTYAALREQQEQEFGENLLKSYIFELHNPKREAQRFIKFIDFLKRNLFEIKEIDKDLLSFYKDDFLFFIDAYDPRFLLIHSPSKATLCNDNFDFFVKRFPSLDRTWFNTSLLESLSYYGEFESWKSVYNSKKIHKESDISAYNNLEWEELSLQIKSRNPRQKLQQIRESNIFKNAFPITSIRIKKDYSEDAFAREDINFLGKFTARGNNFVNHIDIVTRFSKSYSKLVETIENDFSLHFSKENGYYGEPIIIEFPTKIQLEYFKIILKAWFSGTQPFLLWGLIDFKLNDYAVVEAIDLHMGHPLTFEISSDFMRIYLQKDVCGNLITRLLANLEQHFSSSVRILNDKLTKVFNPQIE